MVDFESAASPPLLYVTDHPTTSTGNVEVARLDVLADRIFVREIGACANFVDVDYHRRAFVVLWCDEAAALESRREE
jgi:hypothetical protein